MKKTLTLGAIALLLGSTQYTAWGQSQTTALALASQTESRGSARYQALSGAMGAVGADYSAIHQNPAGLAFFRSGSKLSTTLSHSVYKAQNIWGHNSSSLADENKLHIDELSYISTIQLSSGHTLTWGIGIQNNGRLYRQMDAYSQEVGNSSLANYAAIISNNAGGITPQGMTSSSPFYNTPWLSTLAYNAGWVSASAGTAGTNAYNYKSAYSGSNLYDASLVSKEEGAVSNVDFAFGMDISPRFSIGATLTFSSMNHEYNSFYQEAYHAVNTHTDNNGQTYTERHGLSLDNHLSFSSIGARLGVGFIYQPLDGLRLGASFYTPTLSNVEMSFEAHATGISSETAKTPGTWAARTPSSGARSNFGYTSPWRVGASAAYIFGRKAILSADYEYQNYNQARLREVDEDEYDYEYDALENIYKSDNDAISSDFGGQHTIRIGLEFNATKRLALRAGVRHSSIQNYTPELKENKPTIELLVPGTAVHHRLPGAVHSYSLGLGYRFTPKWTLDLAYTLRTQQDKVASFPYIREDHSHQRYLPQEVIKDTQRQNTISATLNYRF